MPPGVSAVINLDAKRAFDLIAEIERRLAELKARISPAALQQIARQIEGIDAQLTLDIQGAGEAQALSRVFDELEADVSRTAAELAGLPPEIAGAVSPTKELERALDRAGDQADQLGDESAAALAKLRRSVKDGESALGRLERGFKRLGSAAIAAFSIRAIGDFANNALQATAALEESTNKADVTFGDFAKTIIDFAKTAPQALGQTQQAALEAASTFGNLFQLTGSTAQQSGVLAKAIVTLGTDLASFNNTPVDEALNALRSGLIGQSEPLRRFNVLINETVVADEAVRLGLAETTSAVSDAAKVQARYSLIIQQTVKAQGDFARTSTSLANTQRRVTALFGELQVKIGDALRPAFESILDQLPEIIVGLEELLPALTDLSVSLANLAVDAAAPFTALINGISDTIRGLKLLGELSPFALLQNLGDIGQTIDNINLIRLEQGLVKSLRAGEDKAVAAANALAQLGRQGDLTGEQILRFGRLAGLSNLELLNVIRTLQSSPAVFGNTAQAAGVLMVAEARLSEPLGQNVELIRAQQFQLQELGQVQVPPVLRDIPAVLEAIATEQLEFANRFRESINILAGAPEALDLSAKQILKNLQEQTEAVARFEATIAELSITAPNLAAQLKEQGPEVARAAAEFLADPGLAAQAEKIASGRGTDVANAIGRGLVQRLAELPRTAEVKDALLALAAVVGSPQIRDALKAAAAQIGGTAGRSMHGALVEEFDSGLQRQAPELSAAARSAIETADVGRNAVSVIEAQFRAAGLPPDLLADVLAGLVTPESLALARETGVRAADAVIGGLNSRFQITSPSRVTEEMAFQLWAGLEKGWTAKSRGGLSTAIDAAAGGGGTTGSGGGASFTFISNDRISEANATKMMVQGEAVANLLHRVRR